MKFEFTKDRDYIRKHLIQPHVWRMSTDDALAGLNSGLFFIPYESFTWVKADEYGILMLQKIDDDTVRMHIAFNKNCLGKSKEICERFYQWVFMNTSYKTIEALVPGFNHLVNKLIQKTGMRLIKTLAKSYKKYGLTHDQYLYSFNKEVICLG